MRTKDLNNGIIAEAGIEGPEGLEEFLENIAKQIHDYEESHGVHFAVNTVVRHVENGGEHYMPFAYIRDTKLLCGNLRTGQFCARHSVEDVPDFINMQDCSGAVNVYHPYDENHMSLMFDINSGFVGISSDDSPDGTQTIDEFQIIFGEIMSKEVPFPEGSILRTSAGNVKFWKGKLQDTYNKSRETAAKIQGLKLNGDDLIAELTNALGLRYNGGPITSLGDVKDTNLLSLDGDDKTTGLDMVQASELLDRAVKQAAGDENSVTLIDPDNPESMSKLPEGLQKMARAVQSQGGTMRLVRVTQEVLEQTKKEMAGMEEGPAINDLDVSVITDPTKIVKSNKTLH